MATAREKELEARLERLEAALRQFGWQPPAEERPEHPPDFIDHTSPEAAAFKGLVILESEDEADRRVVYQSSKTGRLYCLEDERRALFYCPGIPLADAVYVVLREKVGDYEAGRPPIPENAPPMWTPTPQPFAGIGV